MHSRIFQLGPKKVAKEDYITEDVIDDWFYGSVADYVDESDRKDDIDWLASSLNEYDGITVTATEIKINDKDAFLKSFYAPKLHELKETVEAMTLDDMILGLKPYRVKSIVADTFGFYIHDGSGLMTLGDFIQTLKVRDEDTFYFGNTLDYHY